MAYLYRFEVSLHDKDVTAVVVADHDEIAFQQVDMELEKFYLSIPEIKDITLREKKRITKSSGFILDEDEKGW